MARPGTFQPGKSGNPGGRPKAFNDVVALARSKSKATIERIAWLAENADDQNVQLRANVALHEIAWGKPQQQVNAEVSGGLTITWQNS